MFSVKETRTSVGITFSLFHDSKNFAQIFKQFLGPTVTPFKFVPEYTALNLEAIVSLSALSPERRAFILTF
jgi:hypothetical protein